MSDHLPLSTTLQLTSSNAVHPAVSPSINLEKAVSNGAVKLFEQEINSMILPLLKSNYESYSQINCEIQFVCESICQYAENLLPMCSTRKKRRCFYKDALLKQLCKESKTTWKLWRDVGRPQSGELLDDKITAKKRVQHRINQLNARKERSESESIDRHFKEKAKSRFRAARCGIASGSRLEVNGSIQCQICERSVNLS